MWFSLSVCAPLEHKRETLGIWSSEDVISDTTHYSYLIWFLVPSVIANKSASTHLLLVFTLNRHSCCPELRRQRHILTDSWNQFANKSEFSCTCVCMRWAYLCIFWVTMSKLQSVFTHLKHFFLSCWGKFCVLHNLSASFLRRQEKAVRWSWKWMSRAVMSPTFF